MASEGFWLEQFANTTTGDVILSSSYMIEAASATISETWKALTPQQVKIALAIVTTAIVLLSIKFLKRMEKPAQITLTVLIVWFFVGFFR